ncbi:Uncharacterised protein [Legionella pneumophila]|uniref:hypothetical protein n=1 Tax=Legionella pneumophila TaxID=446 RepID=UPI0007707004|nr:hypothetical protein [Legionella pneumophila]HAT8853866.1 hypothetical protein [Legionella pneumophila subsp. pneumophila]MCZ4726494.1 hypothetical protein [Legionella pneumophila]MDW8937901.1 hypothetical protein [Legionella pneumophila]MDW8940186.1 hypothetical protein [Legionella pneumophila]MDW8947341.1 hypothetical protein [Legionella pneumophila]
MVIHSIFKVISSFLLIISLTILTQVSHATESENYKIVDGIAVYLGILPAEMISGHAKEHTESIMHGGIPSSGYNIHLIVALFDKASGKRITNAKVTARIREIDGMSGKAKELESMQIANTITYGNYFVIGNRGSYDVLIQISRPGESRILEVQFLHQHF